ncbi:MAG TPA: TetR/AcrR family transcriptional regulator [Terriglobales bacterium]|nr:TetR/AcrR family transcriptional regulator [Terriglobales bacterium]
MSTRAIKPAAGVSRANGRKRTRAKSPADSRFDRRLGEILAAAAEVFYEKGYEGASMRDLSRRTGMSLAGLYYYFDSKDKLLYLIQRHTFTEVLDRLHQRLASARDPEDAVRIMIRNHIEYFVANMTAMKVLAHEDNTLKNGYGEEIQAIKREYYRVCAGLLDALRKQKLGNDAAPRKADRRVAVMSLFGMMNWIYTWYNPQVDPSSDDLAGQVSDMFLNGVLAYSPMLAHGKGKVANVPGFNEILDLKKE